MQNHFYCFTKIALGSIGTIDMYVLPQMIIKKSNYIMRLLIDDVYITTAY